MEKLKDPRQEKFCQLLANEDCDPQEAAFRAGYGSNSAAHSERKDGYHTLCANRLLDMEKVNLRINTIRQQNAQQDRDYTSSIVQNLKNIVAFDQTKYLSSNEVVLPNGRTVTDIYLKKPIEQWDRRDALMVNGFDSRGMPKFMDKTWALEKLIKIYGLDAKEGVDVEDMLTLFAGAGLAVGKQLNPTTDDDDMEAEIMKELGDI